MKTTGRILDVAGLSLVIPCPDKESRRGRGGQIDTLRARFVYN